MQVKDLKSGDVANLSDSYETVLIVGTGTSDGERKMISLTYCGRFWSNAQKCNMEVSEVYGNIFTNEIEMTFTPVPPKPKVIRF